MKAIYFGNQDTKNFGKNLVKWSTEGITKSFPKASLKISEKLLCTPMKSSKSMPVDFEIHELDVLGYKLKLYSKGEGDKAILFIHGWSGSASNFNSFYKKALAQGYSVWTIDHIGHGESEGRHANFFLFIESVRAAFQYVRSRKQVEAVVGHSMGASAVISAGLPADVKCVMLAPVIPFFENMFDVITGFGISQSTLDHLITHFENKFSMSRTHLSPLRKWKQFKNPRLIFHDVDDQFIPLEKNLKFIERDDTLNLNITNGLGHFRILKDSAVINESLKFLEEQTD